MNHEVIHNSLRGLVVQWEGLVVPRARVTVIVRARYLRRSLFVRSPVAAVKARHLQMAYSTALGLCTMMVVSLSLAAPSRNWDNAHVFTDVDAKAQLSAPREIRRCACFTRLDPETSENEWFCTEDSDPRCRQLSIGELEIVQKKVLAHQAVEDAQQQKEHECVCYLQVSEQRTDFSCSNPSCYKRFVERKKMAIANSWQNFECIESDMHDTDPDCCRCVDNRWSCLQQNISCRHVLQSCPRHRQRDIAGQCCPVCLEESAEHNSVPAISNHSPESEVDDAFTPCCSYCKKFNDDTEEFEIHISRSDHRCQCDVFVKYPYDELPTCTLSMSEVKKFADKLAKELADVATWEG